jgi:hypothetical protein
MSRKAAGRFQVELKSASLGSEHPEIVKVQRYLTRYGYLSKTISPGTLDAPTSEALKTYQQVMGLETTGELDAETAAALQARRCAIPDMGVIARSEQGVPANFVLIGCNYSDPSFTYRFVNGTGDIAGTQQERQAVRNAFRTWALALCGATFTELTTDPVDFEIGWFTGDHGDDSSFDGVGNTIGHAFYPPPCGGEHAGECHFDDAETWSLTGAGATIDLETTALHEIGHLLGLDHSVAGTVMFASYGGVRRALTQDDIDGIRRLYPFLCRRGDSANQAGFVAEIAAVRHRQHQLITAVRTQAGTLKLIAWNVAAGGAIARTGDSENQAGAATSIAIARNATGSRYVSACRNGSGRLVLISWNVNGPGTSIGRLADSGTQAGTASLIRVVAIAENRFVTACRTSSGTLKLIGWRLNGDGSLTRLADSGNQAGEVRDIALVALANDRVLTAVRASDGTLKLIVWRVRDSAITRQGDSGNQAGDARLVRVVIDQFGNAVTAVKGADDDLKLITWSTTASGNINRLNDSGDLAGETRGHDLSMAGGQVFTGVHAGDGHLKVLLWETAADGTITRIGDSANLAGSASLITQCDELIGAPPLVTSVRTSINSLKLISWSTP